MFLCWRSFLKPPLEGAQNLRTYVRQRDAFKDNLENVGFFKIKLRVLRVKGVQ